MRKYFITGAAGFVGHHLLRELVRESADILGVDRNPAGPQEISRFEVVDLCDRKAVEGLLTSFRPRYIVHLAAGSSVGESWRDPAGCVLNNTAILLNLLETVRIANLKCRILLVGSSEVYGNIPTATMPLTENRPTRPENPYAVGRTTQENLARIYVTGYGLDIVSTRSFMHIGPGQSDRFAVASFVRQLVDAKKDGKTKAILKTGNVDLVRDISDVRDVVRAYRLLLERGRSGEVYNVCRGTAVALREVIEQASSLLELETTIEIDPDRLRPGDPAIVVGCHRKIAEETGWTPTIPLTQTLRDMIDACRPSIDR